MQGVVTRLANRLQRRLMAQQARSWEFDQEEGMLDAAVEGDEEAIELEPRVRDAG